MAQPIQQPTHTKQPEKVKCFSEKDPALDGAVRIQELDSAVRTQDDDVKLVGAVRIPDVEGKLDGSVRIQDDEEKLDGAMRIHDIEGKLDGSVRIQDDEGKLDSAVRTQEDVCKLGGAARTQDDDVKLVGAMRIHDIEGKLDGSVRIQDDEGKFDGSVRIQDDEGKLDGAVRIQDDEGKLDGAVRIQDIEGKLDSAVRTQEDVCKLGDAARTQDNDVKLVGAVRIQDIEGKFDGSVRIQDDDGKLDGAMRIQDIEEKLNVVIRNQHTITNMQHKIDNKFDVVVRNQHKIMKKQQEDDSKVDFLISLVINQQQHEPQQNLVPNDGRNLGTLASRAHERFTEQATDTVLDIAGEFGKALARSLFSSKKEGQRFTSFLRPLPSLRQANPPGERSKLEKSAAGVGNGSPKEAVKRDRHHATAKQQETRVVRYWGDENSKIQIHNVLFCVQQMPRKRRVAAQKGKAGHFHHEEIAGEHAARIRFRGTPGLRDAQAVGHGNLPQEETVGNAGEAARLPIATVAIVTIGHVAHFLVESAVSDDDEFVLGRMPPVLPMYE
ncbi:hypothetical protein niasHT_000327 [Heterodera trifolii]|uniref:Uncharacterized protein n=1 Tax=Heterodera trifolii TaxID=157864 RepID=A0ABD2LQS2_9BILA